MPKRLIDGEAFALKKGSRYSCKSVTGGGREIDQGNWTAVSVTEKRLKLVREYYSGESKTLVVGIDGTDGRRLSRHSFHDWGDGTFTIYPERGGTPYVFEPIAPETEANPV